MWNEFTTVFRDVAAGVAALVGAYVGLAGLHTWRRVLKGNADFETARSLMKSLYHLRDQIDRCRNPLIAPSEFSIDYAIKMSRGEASHKDAAEALQCMYDERLSHVYDAYVEFEVAALEAEALWGRDIKVKSEAVGQLVRSLRAAIDAMIADKHADGEHFRNDTKHGDQVRMKVRSSDSKNPFTMHINKSVADLENAIRPHLMRG